jgi:CheY-like chemotaxis protein
MIVLIVDDNAAVRRLIRSVIGSGSLEIHECATAQEAVAAVDAWRPDWVLMDIELAGTDGIAATREITDRWPGSRVCMVTDYDDAVLREAASRAGACAYVVKQDLLGLPAILSAGGDRA